MTEPNKTKVGLILPGGGARGAYQVGVIKAIVEILDRPTRNPFPIITGTSAGSVNAAVLATNALDFTRGSRRLTRVWQHFRVSRVFRSDPWTLMKTSAHWLSAIVLGGLGRFNPRSLLDNKPLRQLLESHVRFARIQQAIDAGVLDAVAVTSSGYSSARSIAFFEGRQDINPWLRARREGRRTEIELDHLMASIAIPAIFPAVRIGKEFCGDGALRQFAPLSTAIHLGATRLLVIGVRNEVPDEITEAEKKPGVPSLGELAGYMLDVLFSDSLFADLERLTRINQFVEELGNAGMEESGLPFKRVETMIVLPSQDVRQIAERYIHELPRGLRLLLGGLGAGKTGNAQLISYLLFESGFCRELIDLGYRDAMAERDRLRAFLTGEPAPALDAPERIQRQLAR